MIEEMKIEFEKDFNFTPESVIEPYWEWFKSKLKSEIAEACKKQREADAEIFKGYCTLGKGELFAYEDDFNIYCKILANAPSPLEEVK